MEINSECENRMEEKPIHCVSVLEQIKIVLELGQCYSHAHIHTQTHIVHAILSSLAFFSFCISLVKVQFLSQVTSLTEFSFKCQR